MKNTCRRCLPCFSDCITRANTKARAWDWQYAARSSRCIAEASGRKAGKGRERHFIFHCRLNYRELKWRTMDEWKIFLVDDDAEDRFIVEEALHTIQPGVGIRIA